MSYQHAVPTNTALVKLMTHNRQSIHAGMFQRYYMLNDGKSNPHRSNDESPNKYRKCQSETEQNMT